MKWFLGAHFVGNLAWGERGILKLEMRKAKRKRNRLRLSFLRRPIFGFWLRGQNVMKSHRGNLLCPRKCSISPEKSPQTQDTQFAAKWTPENYLTYHSSTISGLRNSPRRDEARRAFGVYFVERGEVELWERHEMVSSKRGGELLGCEVLEAGVDDLYDIDLLRYQVVGGEDAGGAFALWKFDYELLHCSSGALSTVEVSILPLIGR